MNVQPRRKSLVRHREPPTAMLVLSRLDALVRRLLPGLFRERTASGVPISVSDNGTTSVDIHKLRRLAALDELTRESEALGLYDMDLITDQKRAIDIWKARAELAESWHWEAAAALAECNRRYDLPEPLRSGIRILLSWRPE
jgi:hypothetical protein